MTQQPSNMILCPTALAAVLADHLPAHPTFACPFPSAIHPDAEAVQARTTAWAQHYGLLATDAEVARFTKRAYGILMAHAYPTADFERLAVIADWNTWLFALDDQCDEETLGRDLTAMTVVHDRILAIMDGTRPDATAPQYLHAFADLVARMHTLQPAAWLQRLRRELAAYFRANHWESHNRMAGIVPTETDYLTQRPYTGAVYCYITLIELAQQIMLPDHVMADPTIHRIAEITNQSICWSNDCISLQKELAGGDVHNLVYILYYHGWSLTDAIQEVVRRHDAVVAEFVTLRDQTPADPTVQTYLDGMAAWMRANLEWSAATSRYHPRLDAHHLGR